MAVLLLYPYNFILDQQIDKVGRSEAGDDQPNRNLGGAIKLTSEGEIA
ncbi:hypothetical protein PVOR_26930 [Paenibacillus vortex V453]|uniref:Uncharacterized protein n=1 Tax=Paenibacillus vortex V453 TaxID=715225 RepID=A0A2R9SNL7_9BACL|nr:hypothetical protein PVOR_26930 [Paenibacillus vortex V453]